MVNDEDTVRGFGSRVQPGVDIYPESNLESVGWLGMCGLHYERQYE